RPGETSSNPTPDATSAVTTSVSPRPSTGGTLPTTIDLGSPILDISDGYELFARASSVVARIEFAQARTTVERVPGVPSGAGAYFIAGSDTVIARAWDFVP